MFLKHYVEHIRLWRVGLLAVFLFDDVSTYRIRLQDVKNNKTLRLCMFCFMFATFGIMADGVPSHLGNTSGPPRDHLGTTSAQI